MTDLPVPAGVPAGVAAGRRRRRRVIALIAAAVVAAGGAYLGVSLSSGGLSTSGLSALWTDHQLAGSCLETTESTYGTVWTADGLAVTCSGAASVAAYRLGTGAVAWTWQAPKEPGTVPVVLSFSTGATAGTGVVEYTNGSGGVYLGGLDIATGRQRWRVPVTPALGSMIWTGEGRLTVVTEPGAHSADNDVRVYDLATEALDWSWPAPSGCTLGDAVLAGSWVYAASSCSAGRPGRLYQMSLRTGSLAASATLATACTTESPGELWAVPGYVLSGCEGTWSAGRPLVIIPAGGMRQRPLSWTGASGPMEHLRESLRSTAVSGSTLYLGLIAEDSGDEDVDSIAAVDLATATLRWDKIVSTAGQITSGSTGPPVRLLGADSRGVLDVTEHLSSSGGYVTGITLARLSATDGALSYGPGATYPGAGRERTEEPQYALTGSTLLSLPRCFPFSQCLTTGTTGPLTAYSVGSWAG